MTNFYRHIQADLHYMCTGYGVTILVGSFCEETVENAASDGFRWNFARKV